MCVRLANVRMRLYNGSHTNRGSIQRLLCIHRVTVMTGEFITPGKENW